MTSRLRFRLSTMMLAIALAAVLMVCLRPISVHSDLSIEVFGPVTIMHGGTTEVTGGMVRFGKDRKTEVQGDRILIDRDGTIHVHGKGSITQIDRCSGSTREKNDAGTTPARRAPATGIKLANE